MKHVKKNRGILLILMLALLIIAIALPVTAFAEAPAIPTLLVAGTKVTADNQNDILNDGTCSLAYNEETSQWILTLKGANINATGSASGILLNSTRQDFVVKLEGKNTINAVNREGIALVTCDLTVKGPGSLTIISKNDKGLSATSGSSNGDSYGGNITISDGAIVDVTSPYIAIAPSKKFTVANSTLTVNTSEGYNPAISAGTDCVISGSKVTVTAIGDETNAISTWMNGGVTIKENSNVILKSKYQAISSLKEISMDSSSIEATSELSNGIYTAKSVTINNCKRVVLNGYYPALYSSEALNITGSTVTANTARGASAIYAKTSSDISNSHVTAITAGGNGMNAIGDIKVTKGSVLNLQGPGCGLNARQNATIEDSAVEATATGAGGNAVQVAGNFNISGESRIIADGMNYGIRGGQKIILNDGSIDAVSAKGYAIFSYGLEFNSGKLHAKGGEGSPAVVAALVKADGVSPSAQIAIAENYADINGARVSFGQWNADNLSYTSFIAKNDKGDLDEALANAVNEVTIKIKSADNGNKVDKNEASPDTGDNSNTALWWAILLISAGGIIAVGITQKTRKKHYKN